MKRQQDRDRAEGGDMRLAVISDVHGNSAALDAVLADAKRLSVDQVVNLGDSLSGPLDPAGTADRLIDLEQTTILGNHDRWLFKPPKSGVPLWEEWTLPHLTDAHLAWVRELPHSAVVRDVLLTHGTPKSDTEDWLFQRGSEGAMRRGRLSEVAPAAEGLDYAVILSGHTHMPCIVRLPDGRLLVNPGAVGCPAYLDDRIAPPFVAETGAPDARYAILDHVDGAWRASLHVVPYDSSAMIAMAKDKGANSWADALSTGWMRE